jgi:small GTP-binding protein
MTAPRPKEVDYIFKVILVGDAGVGKTSLTERFVDNRFHEDILSTIAVDFKTHIMEVDGKIAKIQIWDTAGAERFRSVARSFYRGANAVMFCYDVAEALSFTHLSTWLEELNRTMLPETPCIIVGCKCDLSSRRAIPQQQAIDFAKQFNYGYIETSAKENTNVPEAFKYIVRKAIYDAVQNCHNRQASPSATGTRIFHRNSTDLDKTHKKGCC